MAGWARLDIQKKSTHALEQERPDILKRRQDWFDRQPDLDPERLVFIDETGLSTKMARLRGRSLCGERCRAGPDVLARILPGVCRATGCSKRELTSILQHVRMQGYATSHGGGARELSGIAAPVFDARGVACFSLAILVPSRQVRGRVAQLGRLVREGAAEMSVILLD